MEILCFIAVTTRKAKRSTKEILHFNQNFLFPLRKKEPISNRICIEVTTRQDSQIIISQRKGRLAFTTRCPVNSDMRHRLDGLFVQPIDTIWLDGTFGSVDATVFMDTFIKCEDAAILGDALIHTITQRERMEKYL